MEYFFVVDFLWILLVALLLASVFSYGTRDRIYTYENSSIMNFMFLFLGSILIGYLFVWLFELLGFALLTGIWNDVLWTVVGALFILIILWGISEMTTEY